MTDLLVMAFSRFLSFISFVLCLGEHKRINFFRLDLVFFANSPGVGGEYPRNRECDTLYFKRLLETM